MPTRLVIILITIGILAVASGSLCLAQEFYYDLDTTYQVVPSNLKITVQFDTTQTMQAQSQFFAAHPCLDASVEAKYLTRDFWIYALQPSCGYEASAAELRADAAVHRVVPIYMTHSSPAGFKVSDMVDVQFDLDLPRDAALALLAGHGLHFVDSSEYKHNLWRCALDDTIRTSPLPYGNAMHVLPGVEWACARQYVTPVLMGAPTDPYYQHQYYLKNTRQNGGTLGIDINVEPAWRIPLSDSSLLVAVIDDGIAPHTDLPTSRIVPGWNFTSSTSDVSPWLTDNHGMACAGILAASHNDTGVAGVFGSCRILPIVTFSELGHYAGDSAVGEAIRYAGQRGARVISCSWGIPQTEPIACIANAIRDVTNDCGKFPGQGCVMVFSAGNGGEGLSVYICPYDDLPAVHFPANMPEVIAVGAVDNTGARWDYSSYGSALDVMAPSGRVCSNQSAASSQWTVDQMSDLGWNPYVTGEDDANGDEDYTSAMGGTSGASPQVAGIAALLLARGHDSIKYCNPGPKILEIITKSAVDLSPPGRDDYTGYGLANACRALLSVIHGDVTNDGILNVSDVMLEISIAFENGHAVLDDRTADVNCSGMADVNDVLYLQKCVFSNGPMPPICFRY